MSALSKIGIVLAATAIASVLELSSASFATSQAVAIDTFRFVPAAVTVNVGDSVTWTNRDAAQHTATAPGAFDTGTLSQGQSRVIVMGTAGTFAYRCSIHPTMTGTVQVTGTPPTVAPTVAPTPPPTVAPTPAPATTAPIPQPTATAAPAPTVAPTQTPVPPTPPATATAPAASPSPTPDAALVSQASPAATAPPEPGAVGSQLPVGLIAGAGAVAIAGAAAALVLWRSRRRAA